MNINKKIIYLSALSLGLVLNSACKGQKKEVDYVDAGIEVATDTDAVNTSSGNTVADAIGYNGEKYWEATVGGKSFNVSVIVPDAAVMCTQEFEEYYYTKADKKRFMEAVFDKDSQIIDKETIDYPCRESMEALIEEHTEDINNLKQMLDGIDYSNEIEYHQNIIDELKAKLGEAPARADVSTDVGDYSDNYYRAKIDGIEYSVKFYSDPENNISKINMVPISYEPFNHAGEKIEPMEDYTFKGPQDSGMNVSMLSYDELKANAENFLEKLGITGMTATDNAMLRWYVDVYSKEDGVEVFHNTNEYNGYAFLFTREIAGLGVCSDLNISSYYGYTKTRAYSQEYIVVDVSDGGIMSFSYNGIMKPVTEPKEVKLLSYENIKQVCMNELDVDSDNIMKLIYVRVASEDKKDRYCYVPMWRIDNHVNDKYNLVGTISWGIYINAIDGDIRGESISESQGSEADYNRDNFERQVYR